MPEPKRLLEAKQKSDEYRQDSTDGEASSTSVQSSTQTSVQGKPALSEWTDIVGQRIEQAMREGLFDNLPGQGKPLDLKKNPFVPEDRQMAYKLLENNDLAPSWISARTGVLKAIESLRAEIGNGVRAHQAVQLRTSDPETADQLVVHWESRTTDWAGKIAALNKDIETVNLQQPIAHLEIIKLRLPDELARAGAGSDRLSQK